MAAKLLQTSIGVYMAATLTPANSPMLTLVPQGMAEMISCIIFWVWAMRVTGLLTLPISATFMLCEISATRM